MNKHINLFELEEEFLVKRKNGMDISEIRKELLISGVDKEGVTIIVRSIDNKLLHGVLSKQEKNRKSQLFYSGLAIAIVGIIITIGSFFGYFGTGSYGVLVYGPVLGGASMMAAGRNRRSTGRFK